MVDTFINAIYAIMNHGFRHMCYYSEGRRLLMCLTDRLCMDRKTGGLAEIPISIRIAL